jgi:predicted DNA-binding transcriptional regulator YafY
MPRQGPTADTVHRLLTILSHVPRAPRRIDTERLEHILQQQGIQVHRRSIQRDLESLSARFRGLECDLRSKPYGWSWRRDSPLFDLPSMDPHTAVTLDLVRAHLVDALPRSTLAVLDPYFERAKKELKTTASTALGRWTRKVRVVPRGLVLEPPPVLRPVLETVYTALLEERRFAVQYRPRGAKVARDYEVSPLGLIVRSGVLVLVCTLRDYEDVRLLLLHRMARAELTHQPARVPRVFDLDRYVSAGGLSFALSESIELELLVTEQVLPTIIDTPLASDQKLESTSDGRTRLVATVTDSLELRGWIASYGALIEVVAPPTLRRAFAASAQALAKLYG